MLIELIERVFARLRRLDEHAEKAIRICREEGFISDSLVKCLEEIVNRYDELRILKRMLQNMDKTKNTN